MGSTAQDDYAHLLSEYHKIQAEMDRLKKVRTDQFVRSLPEEFKAKLCEMTDQEVTEFADEMSVAVTRWINANKKKVYRDNKKQSIPSKAKNEVQDVPQIGADM